MINLVAEQLDIVTIQTLKRFKWFKFYKNIEEHTL